MTASGVPRHVAIIMDGNGRWARSRDLPRSIGHRRGVDRIHPIALACARRGVEYLTLYAFSTENWRRPRAEVAALLRLLATMIDDEARTCLRDNLRLRLIGTVERLEPLLQQKVQSAVELNRNNTGMMLCLAFDYGSRDEMARAAQAMAAASILPQDVDENQVAMRLYTAGMPDVDLLIRCGGEQRLSNFLMWQAAYAELYFSPKLWPDWDRADLAAALEDYARRSRRFGGAERNPT